VPGQDPGAARLGLAGDHADQGGLADARFAADQDQARTALQDRVDALVQR
jgi:hypothetical protein